MIINHHTTIFLIINCERELNTCTNDNYNDIVKAAYYYLENYDTTTSDYS